MLNITKKSQSIEIVHPDQTKQIGKAFDYLYEEKIAAVNVVWATGKRTDHTITNLTILFAIAKN
jgi:thiamine pyrophosphokinase